MTWQPGRDKISALLAAGELEQVAVNDQVARRLLQDAARHLATAAAAASGEDLSGAYLLAYDAFRKSAASLLAVQGLRRDPVECWRELAHEWVTCRGGWAAGCLSHRQVRYASSLMAAITSWNPGHGCRG